MDQPDERRAGLSARERSVLFFLALVPRLLVLAELSGTPWNEVLLGDARAYDVWGQQIAAGDWIGREVFYQAPLYPYLLGASYALLGHVPVVVRLLQCVLASLAAVWIAQGTGRMASRRAALLAGGLAALYEPLLWYDVQIEKTSLACSLSAALFLLAAPGAGATRGRALACGALVGALALLRENAAVLLVPLAWLLGREAAGRAGRLGALCAGTVLVLLPVAGRNLALGGAPLPTASNAGVNFYIGNGAEADGMYRPLVAGRGHPDHEREDATRIAEELSGRSLGPAEVSGFWLALALQEIRAEPGHFAALLARKARLLLHHGEIMDACAIEVFEDESGVLRLLAPLSFGILLALVAAGLVIAHGRPAAAWPRAAAGWLALSILAFFVVGRFRLGLVPFLFPFAGIALAEGLSSPRRRLAALAAAGAALVSFWPLDLPGNPRATSAANLASELLRESNAAEAEVWARRAWEHDPGSADAAFNLGLVLRRLGRDAEAEAPFEAAMALEPAYAADCLAELGAVRATLGDRAGARQLLERALALDPGHGPAREYLGRLEARGSE